MFLFYDEKESITLLCNLQARRTKEQEKIKEPEQVSCFFDRSSVQINQINRLGSLLFDFSETTKIEKKQKRKQEKKNQKMERWESIK